MCKLKKTYKSTFAVLLILSINLMAMYGILPDEIIGLIILITIPTLLYFFIKKQIK